jgi:hypothetical protein
MNKLMLGLVVWTFGMMSVGLAFGQEQQEAKTLLGHGKPFNKKDWGYFVAPALGFTQMDGANATLFHIRGGIDHRSGLSMGMFYSRSMNDIRPQSEAASDVYLDYQVVGGFAEYTLWSKRLFHLSLPLYIGYGEVELDTEDGSAGMGEANFYQVEPSALLEVNVHRFVRFNVGAGYRFVGQMTYRNMDQRDLSGFTGYVGLKIGVFR